MSSLKEKALTLPRIILDTKTNDEVVLEIRYNGVKIDERIVTVTDIAIKMGATNHDFTVLFKQIK